jgi:hypothetical protein
MNKLFCSSHNAKREPGGRLVVAIVASRARVAELEGCSARAYTLGHNHVTPTVFRRGASNVGAQHKIARLSSPLEPSCSANGCPFNSIDTNPILRSIQRN